MGDVTRNFRFFIVHGQETMDERDDERGLADCDVANVVLYTINKSRGGDTGDIWTSSFLVS